MKKLNEQGYHERTHKHSFFQTSHPRPHHANKQQQLTQFYDLSPSPQVKAGNEKDPNKWPLEPRAPKAVCQIMGNFAREWMKRCPKIGHHPQTFWVGCQMFAGKRGVSFFSKVIGNRNLCRSKYRFIHLGPKNTTTRVPTFLFPRCSIFSSLLSPFFCAVGNCDE